MRRFAIALLLTLPLLAPAQTPVAAGPPGNISVEAVEVVRQKPDTVKLFMKVEARNAESAAATDEATDEAKKVLEGLGKVKLPGVTIAAQPHRTVRIETMPPRGGPGVQGAVEFRVIKPITVTVSEADYDKFTAAVEKVQAEAFKLGLVPDLLSDTFTYNSSSGQQEKNSPFRAVYSRKGGWDDLTGPALEKATKKARAKAEALAAGAGVTLGGVSSVNEVTAYAASPSYNPYGSAATAGDPEDELSEGELLRKVRVRVVFATK